MGLILSKFVKWGTGNNESSAQDIPADYNPSNYNPKQVSNEGVDKISSHLKGIDEKIKKNNTMTLSLVNDSTKTNLTSFTIVNKFVYLGTSNVNNISSIDAIVRKAAGPTSGEIRIYDATNAQEIALLSFTETIDTIKNLGQISNLPLNSAIIEVQLKRTGGNLGDYIYLQSLNLNFN